MRLPVAGLVILLAFGGCKEKETPSLVPLTQADLPSQESWKSKVIFSDSARTKAVLWAGHIAVYSMERHTLLDDSIHVDFYNEQEQHTSTLTARRGKVHDERVLLQILVAGLNDPLRELRHDRSETNAGQVVHGTPCVLQQAEELQPVFIGHALVIGGQPPMRIELVSFV